MCGTLNILPHSLAQPVVAAENKPSSPRPLHHCTTQISTTYMQSNKMHHGAFRQTLYNYIIILCYFLRAFLGAKNQPVLELSCIQFLSTSIHSHVGHVCIVQENPTKWLLHRTLDIMPTGSKILYYVWYTERYSACS